MALRPRLSFGVLLALVLVSPAAAQDGAIVARDTLRPTPEQRAHFLRLIEARGHTSEKAASVLDGVVVERITYLSDGLRIRGYLAAPVEGAGLPAVIYNRGGNRGIGALTDTTAAAFFAPLAARGYVVVGSQYRGGPGSEGQDEFGGRDVRDVLHLLPLLDAHPRVDPSRIGMYGRSRGGMMTYLALTQTGRVRAAVVDAGMSDAFATAAERPDVVRGAFAPLVPNWTEQREAALDARSAVRWAVRLPASTPLLLLHGSADWRASPAQTLAMAGALHAARRPFRLVLFEGGDHELTEHRAEVFRQVAGWFDRDVRDGEEAPDLEPHGD